MSTNGDSGFKWFIGIVVAVAAGVIVPIYLATRDDAPDSRASQPGTSVEAPQDSGARTIPHVYLNRTSGAANSQVVVSGDGFTPREQIVLRFHTTEVARTTADEAGKFQGVVTTVPTALGAFAPQQFNVTASGETSIKTAHAAFTVSG